MKKLMLLALAAVFASSAMALENEPKPGFTYQVFAGFDVSNVTDFNFDAKVGVNFGFKADYVLPNAKGTYITAGVDWIQKGAKWEYPNYLLTTGLVTGVNKLQAHYLEVPIRAGFRYNINKDWGVFGEVGPYFAVGVTGKNKMKNDDDLIPDTHSMYFGKHYANAYGDPALNDVKGIQRFDCGIGFRIGGEYNNQYSLTFGYDWGFTDVFTNDFRRTYAASTGGLLRLPERKNHNMTLTFGFRF